MAMFVDDKLNQNKGNCFIDDNVLRTVLSSLYKQIFLKPISQFC